MKLPVIESSLLKAAEKSIGFQKSSKEEWIPENTRSLLEERRKAKSIVQESCKEEDKIIYRRLNRDVQRCFKTDRTKWVDLKSSELETAAKHNDTRLVFKLTAIPSGRKSRTTATTVTSLNGEELVSEETETVERTLRNLVE